MNRREFILQGLRWGGTLLLGTALSAIAPGSLKAVSEPAEAAAEHNYLLYNSGLPITENTFSFDRLRLRTDTERIIIHHSAIGFTDEVTAADIHRVHHENGWSGIGYHFYVHKSGLIETGRPLEDAGAHTYRYNNTSLGICLAGDFTEELPSDAQMESLAKLTGILCQMYCLKPSESIVAGHSDFNETACPGENLYMQLPNLRESAGRFI